MCESMLKEVIEAQQALKDDIKDEQVRADRDHHHPHRFNVSFSVHARVRCSPLIPIFQSTP